MNVSNPNIRQSIKLTQGGTGGKNGRIQSAVNTAHSTAYGGGARLLPGGQFPQLHAGGYASSSAGLNVSHDASATTGAHAPNLRPPRPAGARTIPNERDTKSADIKTRSQPQGAFAQREPSVEQINNFLSQGAPLPMDLSMHEDQRQLYRFASPHGQRPNTSIPHANRNLMQGSNDALGNMIPAPALYNHQAYSRKSFRIRGQTEQEMMKLNASASNKDIAMIDFNNGK